MGFTLRNISDSICREKKIDGDCFYQECNKRFKEIIGIFDLDEEYSWLKKNRSYDFAEVDFEFWRSILIHYTDEPIVSLRRKEFDKLPYESMMFLLQGILRNFCNAQVSEEKLAQVEGKLKKIRQIIEINKIRKNLDNMKRIISLREQSMGEFYLHENDKMEWLIALNIEFDYFWDFWRRLLIKMNELREEEEKLKMDSLSCEQREWYEKGRTVCRKTCERLNKDEEYQRMLSEKDELYNFPKSKMPLYEKIKEKLKELEIKIEQRRIEVNDVVSKELYPGIDYDQKAWEELAIRFWSSGISEKELFEEAKEEIEELNRKKEARWNFDNRREKINFTFIKEEWEELIGYRDANEIWLSPKV